MTFTIKKDPKEREARRGRNVIALLEGSDPALKDEYVLVTAHFDHVGVVQGRIYHGADDNASGVAGVLETARTFASGRLKPKLSILFLLFDSERGRPARWILLLRESRRAYPGRRLGRGGLHPAHPGPRVQSKSLPHRPPHLARRGRSSAPGIQGRERAERERRASGIPIEPQSLAALREWSTQLGVLFPVAA